MPVLVVHEKEAYKERAQYIKEIRRLRAEKTLEDKMLWSKNATNIAKKYAAETADGKVKY